MIFSRSSTFLVEEKTSFARLGLTSTAYIIQTAEFENKDPSKIRWSRAIIPSQIHPSALQKKGLKLTHISLENSLKIVFDTLQLV
jgi:hypothetical protein